MKMTKYASIWFENLKAHRRRSGKEKIDTWEKLKKKMKEKFLPREYEQEQYIKLTSLMHEDLSVAEYTRDFERLCIVCDMQENGSLKISRYLKGLSKRISNKVDVANYTTFEDLQASFKV